MQLAPEKYVAVVHNYNMQTAAPTAIVKQIVIFFPSCHITSLANRKSQDKCRQSKIMDSIRKLQLTIFKNKSIG